MKVDGILQINDELNSILWKNEQLSPIVHGRLLEIAENFFSKLDLGVDLEDITITGSMANYNWTKYSDIDLHIVIDFSEIDDNRELVREFFSSKTSNWNKNHNISFFGHEIEIYVQNLNEKHFSTGVYSLLNNEWSIVPTKVDPKVDVEMVKRKANSLIDMIERAEDMYLDRDYSDAYDFSLRLIERIKKFRQSGLEGVGEYSNENLTFKYLRNHKYTDILFGIRNNSYDRMMSLDGDHDRKFKIFIQKEDAPEESGFHRLNEIGKFQKSVRRRHMRQKKRLLRRGPQNPGGAFPKKPSYKRSKSSPAGFGGT